MIHVTTQITLKCSIKLLAFSSFQTSKQTKMLRYFLLLLTLVYLVDSFGECPTLACNPGQRCINGVCKPKFVRRAASTTTTNPCMHIKCNSTTHCDPNVGGCVPNDNPCPPTTHCDSNLGQCVPNVDPCIHIKCNSTTHCDSNFDQCVPNDNPCMHIKCTNVTHCDPIVGGCVPNCMS